MGKKDDVIIIKISKIKKKKIKAKMHPNWSVDLYFLKPN